VTKHKSWKDALLSSGLPLEYEVKRYLEAKGCLPRVGYPYLRANEFRIPREFSYDLDATVFQNGYCVDLMVECKYRNPAVRWIWTAENYGGPNELHPNDFLHPIEAFGNRHFPFGAGFFPSHLGPACSKGVELFPDGPSEAGISEAISQLAYAFGAQLADAVRHQAFGMIPGISIYCHIPIIVTTAPMFRMREDASIATIKAANDIEEVSTVEDVVVLRYSPGPELVTHTRAVFDQTFHNERPELAAALGNENKDLDRALELLSESPRSFVVLSVARGWEVFDAFFTYLEQLLDPPEALVIEIQEHVATARARFDASINTINPAQAGVPVVGRDDDVGEP
jgi:hypothetical protein